MSAERRRPLNSCPKKITFALGESVQLLESATGSSSVQMAASAAKGQVTAARPLLVEFDQIFDSIRHYGLYQFFMLVTIQISMLNSAGNYIFISFATLKPTCNLPVTVSDRPISAESDGCLAVADCPFANQTSIFHSLYEEGEFICPEHPHLPYHMQTLQAIGGGVGAIVGGHAADMWGRKWITYFGAVFMCFFGLAGAFSPNWHWLATAMFGMGLSYGALIDSSMTLASETVGPRYRIVQTLAFQWSLALQIASLVAYLTSDWRRYLLAINGICTPILLLMLFWQESPRWLIQKHRHQEACDALNSIAKWNGCEARLKPTDLAHIQLSNDPQQGGRSSKVYSFWDLFSTRQLALYSLVMIFSALTVETSVAVIIFDVQVLAGSPFWNIAFYGLLRIWVPFFIVLMEVKKAWFGRRLLFISSQTITVLCFTGVVILIAVSGHSQGGQGGPMTILRTVLSLVGGVVNSSIFFTIYKQYSIELYPTLMRAMAVGCFGVVERIGGALAPQLINLNSLGWEGTALTVTTALAAVSLVSGYVLLPETKNQAMPDVYSPGRRKEKEAGVK